MLRDYRMWFPDRRISLKEKHQIKDTSNLFKYLQRIIPQEMPEAGQQSEKSRKCCFKTTWNGLRLNLKRLIPTRYSFQQHRKSSKIPSHINSSCSNYLQPVSIKHSGMQLNRSRMDKVPWTCAHSTVGNNTGNIQVIHY